MSKKNKKFKYTFLIIIVAIIAILVCRYNFRKNLNVSLDKIRINKYEDNKDNSLSCTFYIDNSSDYNIHSIRTTPIFPKELKPYVKGWRSSDMLSEVSDNIRANQKEYLTRIIYVDTDNISDEKLLELTNKIKFKFNYISYKERNPFSFGYIKQYFKQDNSI